MDRLDKFIEVFEMEMEANKAYLGSLEALHYAFKRAKATIQQPDVQNKEEPLTELQQLGQEFDNSKKTRPNAVPKLEIEWRHFNGNGELMDVYAQKPSAKEIKIITETGGSLVEVYVMPKDAVELEGTFEYYGRICRSKHPSQIEEWIPGHWAVSVLSADPELIARARKAVGQNNGN